MTSHCKSKLLTTSGLAGILLTCCLVAETGLAQEAENEVLELEEVVVTAQFRKQSIKDVPIAMSAYDAEFMRAADMEDMWDVLDLTPGFAGGGTGGSWLNTISVRGIRTNDFGVGGDTSVGVFKDGVYQGRTGAAVTNFYDMERSEALRGPQGFLYGRNTISGAINTITNKPNPEGIEAFGQITLGERNLHEVEAMLNVPLAEGWAARAAAYSVSEDGYITNVADPDGRKLGKYRSRSARFSIGYEGESVEGRVIAEYERRNGDGVVYRSTDLDNVLTDLGFSETEGGREVSTDFPGHDDARIFTLTGLVDWDLGDVIISSVTGYRWHDWDYSEDDDGSSDEFYHWLQNQEVENFSQDIRVASNTDGKLTWLVGVSGYVEKIKAGMGNQSNEDTVCLAYYGLDCVDTYGTFNYHPDGLLELVDIEGTYRGIGVSANATYALTEKLEIDAGVRYSYDEKDFSIGARPVESEIGPFLALGYFSDGMVNDKKSWDDFAPRVALRYTLSDDLTLWGSVTRGYKAGGFSSFSMDLPSPESLGLDPCPWGIYCVLNADGSVPEGTKPLAFEPESVWSYEIGLKGDMADGRVQFDVNAFYYQYKDMQLKYWDTDLFNVVIENVGRVKGYGIEGMVKAQATEKLHVQVGASLMNTKVTEIPDVICDCEGNRLSQQPKFVMTGLIVYNHPLESGEVSASADFRYQSQIYGGLANEDTNSYGGRARVSARIGYYSNDGWGISAYADNLLNDLYYGGGTGAGYPFPQLQFDVVPPRSFGFTVNYRFGG